MNENLIQFLLYNFKEILFLRQNIHKHKLPQSEWYKIIKHYGKHIESFNPDIAIMCIIQNNIVELHNLSKD